MWKVVCMVQAVLIEDEEATRDFVKKNLVAEFAKNKEQLVLETYEDGRDFLKILGDAYHYDVLFLDIEMPGIDGLTLAKRIRTSMPHVLLVFVSGRDRYVFKSFEVQPFRFIRKQEFLKQAPDLVRDLLGAIRTATRRAIYLTEPGTGDIYSFDVNSLLYVEARRKECRVVADTGASMIRCPFRAIAEQLEPWRFIQCHRSYLVNWRAIYRIGRSEILLTSGESIPLSRGMRENVHREFMRIVEEES